MFSLSVLRSFFSILFKSVFNVGGSVCLNHVFGVPFIHICLSLHLISFLVSFPACFNFTSTYVTYTHTQLCLALFHYFLCAFSAVP